VPGTHPIKETSCKEGAEYGPRPVVNLQDKSVLQPVSLRDENVGQNQGESDYGEIVLTKSAVDLPSY
jgi:hypothetical protein